MFSINSSIQVGMNRELTVWARGRKLGREDCVVFSEAVSGRRVAVTSFYAGVARRVDDADALETKLQDLGALTALVVNGEVRLGATVTDGDNGRGLVDSALQFALVSAWRVAGVWVRRIQWRVSFLSECVKGAVASVDGVEEVVQEALEDVVLFIHRVIGLVKDGVLGVDDWVRDLEVERRLEASLRWGNGCNGAINEIQYGLRAVLDVWREKRKESIEIFLSEDIVKILKDSQLVPGRGFGTFGYVVQSYSS
jgi:hypothetical protein